MRKIAIVTLDYNNHKDTDEYLKSSKILDTSGLDMLWLVVDNGSDESVADIVKKYPGVIWIQTGENIGFAGGFNRGMKYAKEWGAEFVLIVNNDTLFSDKYLLKTMLQVFNDNPKVGVVSPKILFAKGYEFQDGYKKNELGKVIWYAGGSFDWKNIRSIHRGIDVVDNGQYNVSEKTDFVSGCCILVRTDLFDKVGYFEEKLFAYYEDSDWIERLKKAGYYQWYEGNSFINHKVSRTSVVGSEWSDYLITRNRLWFGNKYASYKTRLALFRESIKLLFFGRNAQKEGIIDYHKNIWGWKHTKINNKAEYPLNLSIVVINYKTTDLTLNLLKSIYNKESGFDAVEGGTEVIVLDNSPEDSCRDVVTKKYPQVKFIQNNINNGFSGGNNQMINYSLGKNMLLLNSDMEVKSKSIITIMKAVKKYGDRSIYAGRLVFGDGSLQNSCFKLPTPKHAFEEYFLNKKGSYSMFAPKHKKYTKVEGAVMACFLIPRKVINEIGVLSEETFMYFEDIEYCRRAKKKNIPIYYISDSEFIHYHGQSSKKAGIDMSNERLIKASKWYHGPLNYFLVTAILWLGQKMTRKH